MNERIKELMIEAGFFPTELTQVGPSVEKFAELIVQECASIVYKTDTNHADGLALLLLQHFGVEE